MAGIWGVLSHRHPRLQIWSVLLPAVVLHSHRSPGTLTCYIVQSSVFFDEKMQMLLVRIMSFLEGRWSLILLSYRILFNGVDLKTFIHV